MTGAAASTMWSAEIGTRTLYRKAAHAEPEPPAPRRRTGPRGYAYSPTRIQCPQVGAVLLELFREARGRLGDPVSAWADVVGDPDRANRYKAARGRGGLERVTWEEAAEIFAAAHVHVIGRWGPDRIAGVSGNPAGAVSHAAGARFVSLIGGAVLTPGLTPGDGMSTAGPRVVGETGDWQDTDYLVMWGSGLPSVTMQADGRPRHKVVAISPDQSGGPADEWLTPAPGTDGALAMAMGHVVLKEFFVNSPVDYFISYAKRFTDLPYLVALDSPSGDGRWQPGKLVTAADLPTHDMLVNAAFKPMVIDERTASPAVPEGALGHRCDVADEGRWSLADNGIDPRLSLARSADFTVDVVLPRFDEPDAVVARPVPVRRLGTHLVTTVYDLMLAQYAVAEGPNRYGDPDTPYTPAWQESLTGVPAHAAARIAREFARNAARTRGRSTIVVGAHDEWFHADTADRAMLALTMLTGCQGVAGGGRVRPGETDGERPITGWSRLALGLDWAGTPRETPHASYGHLHGGRDGGRADASGDFPADLLAGPTGVGRLAGRSTDDLLALATRLGWLPSYPSFDRNPLDLVDDATAAGIEPVAYVVDELVAGRLRFACEDPGAERNHPRVATVWDADPSDEDGADVIGRPVVDKLDLLCTLDSQATDSTSLCDLVLPTAAWHDTDDIAPVDLAVPASGEAAPREAATQWAAFAVLAAAFSRLAARHLGVRRDLVAAPLRPDTADSMVTPRGVVRDWRTGECEPIPGRTLPRLVVVERDYPALADRFRKLGPRVDGPRVDGPRGGHIERLEPWPTLTGRQHFYLDHDWLLELGEHLPTYRPPLDLGALRGDGAAASEHGPGELRVTVRYLTARDEWSIRAEQDDGRPERAGLSPVWPMTPGTGSAAWLAESDAERLDIAEGDWVEVGNPRGRVRARALVSPRLTAGTVYLQRPQSRPEVGSAGLIAARSGPAAGSRRGPALFKPSRLIGGYGQPAAGRIPCARGVDEASVLRKQG